LKLSEVASALEDPTVWDNPKRAQELGKEKKSLEDVVVVLDRLTSELADNSELFEMSEAEATTPGWRPSKAKRRTCRPRSRNSSSAACSTTRPIR
jgi:protein subunit release factor A